MAAFNFSDSEETKDYSSGLTATPAKEVYKVIHLRKTEERGRCTLVQSDSICEQQIRQARAEEQSRLSIKVLHKHRTSHKRATSASQTARRMLNETQVIIEQCDALK